MNSKNVFFVFSLRRCGYHSRTLLPTLDSREILTSVTAALQTQPCLFPYVSAWGDYTKEPKKMNKEIGMMLPKKELIKEE